MLREEFDQLVQRIEQRYHARPASLKWKVIFYAVIGYCAIWAWMLLIIPLLSLCLYALWLGEPPVGVMGIGILLLVFAGFVIARRVNFIPEKIEGVELRPDRFPEFFKQLNRLSDQSGSYRFDRVWIQNSCNAGVRETGRFIWFGISRKHLVIGLPLMEVVSHEELFAVLAHEVAHLSARHAWLTGWLYRLRIKWQVIHNRRRVVPRYWRWYWPLFNAHAFVLSRQHEYQADRVAAEHYGPNQSLSALVRIHIAAHMEHRFWEQLWNRTQTESEPPATAFQELSASLQKEVSGDEISRWIEQMLTSETDNTDTHPSFRYRAAAVFPEFNPRNVAIPLNELNSAQSILKDQYLVIRDTLQKEWGKTSTKNWEARYKRNHSLKGLLKGIDAVGDFSQADAELAFERALVVVQVHGLSSAESLLRRTLFLRPNHPRANYLLGCLLLENGDHSGDRYLEHCMAVDEDYTVTCSEALLQSAIRKGDRERIRQLRRQMDDYEKNRLKAHREALIVKWTDAFTQHELPGNVLTRLDHVALSYPEVNRIHLARKIMKYSKKKLYVLVVSLSMGASRKVISDLGYKLSFPGSFLVVSSDSERIIRFKLGRIPTALVYSKR